MKYQPGTLKVVAYKDGKKWATDEMKTSGPAAKLTLQPDRAKIAADGQDLSYITVTVADKNGLLVPRSNNHIKFEIEGPGEIVADWTTAMRRALNRSRRRSTTPSTGWRSSSSAPKPVRREPLRSTAESDGLKSAAIRISSK